MSTRLFTRIQCGYRLCVILCAVLLMITMIYRSSPITEVSYSEWDKLSLRHFGENGTVKFQYSPRPEIKHITTGRAMEFTSDQLKMLGFPLKDFITVTKENVEDYVFVTAASEGFIAAAVETMANVQRFAPNRTIYFYDLSREPNDFQVKQIQSMCNVKYRRFEYVLYPDHVKTGITYAFKPIIAHEMLREHAGIFWIDTSIRFNTANFSVVYSQLVHTGGFLTFDTTGHSIFSATHPTMMEYLPVSFNQSVENDMRGAPALIIYRTREIYNNIVKWWFLCALIKDCIAPTKDLYCRFNGRDKYGNCHRYDQSAITILALNHYLYDNNIYRTWHNILGVERGSMGKETAVKCNTAAATTPAFKINR